MNAFLFLNLYAINGICAMETGRVEPDLLDDYRVWIELRPTSTEINDYLHFHYYALQGNHLPRHEELRDKMKKLEREIPSQNGFFQMGVRHPTGHPTGKWGQYTARWSEFQDDLLPKLIQAVGADTRDARIIKRSFPWTNSVGSYMFKSSREHRGAKLQKWLESILNGKSLTSQGKGVIRREFNTFCEKMEDRYSPYQLEEKLGYPFVQVEDWGLFLKGVGYLSAGIWNWLCYGSCTVVQP